MSRPSRLPLAFPILCATAAGLCVETAGLGAQTESSRARASLAAWVEAAKASPFHRSAEAGAPKTGTPGAIADMRPRPSPAGWPVPSADPDGIPRGRLFGYTLVAASIPTAVAALFNDSLELGGTLLLVYGWLGTQLTGQAVAAKKAGVGPGRAIFSSLVGVGTGVGGLLLMNIGQVSGWIAAPFQVLLTAGVTTLIASADLTR